MFFPDAIANATVNAPFTQPISVSGGTAPYVNAITNGALPAGFWSFSAAGCSAARRLFRACRRSRSWPPIPARAMGRTARSMQYSVTVANVLNFTSTAQAVVNPAKGLEYAFTAYIQTSLPVVVTWDFGDGTAPQTGNPIAHAFPAISTYTVTVQVSDGINTISQQISVTVNSTALTQPVPIKVGDRETHD